jgi:hypothetical protein
MGPTIILDKSAFQSLSWREHLVLDVHFTENLTPILGLELLADLRKEEPGTRPGDEIAKGLAAKFGGSGPATNIDYRTLCILSLQGETLPSDGRIVVEASHVGRTSDGSLGALIDLSPLNRGILRWSKGHFEEFEREFAAYWGERTKSLEMDSLLEELSYHHVIIPKVETIKELREEVDRLLATATLQDVWLKWLFAQLEVGRVEQKAISARWKGRSHIFLREFAPYAWHCLRVVLSLVGATRHRLIPQRPTNLLDIQYLYYAPFCMVFSSNDRVHKALAPLLLRGDQIFVSGEDLKHDLERIADFREGLSPEEMRYLAFALGSYPPPTVSRVVQEIWRKHCRPWNPRMVNLASSLSKKERDDAIQWVQAMFSEAQLDMPSTSQ